MPGPRGPAGPPGDAGVPGTSIGLYILNQNIVINYLKYSANVGTDQVTSILSILSGTPGLQGPPGRFYFIKNSAVYGSSNKSYI